MNKTNADIENNSNLTIITAGSSYLDIDAYACCVAMKELLQLKGEAAVAYSDAHFNYSICQSLIEEGQVINVWPPGYDMEKTNYIIVDVSDPIFIGKYVPLNRVKEVYDHHVGFEEYWKNHIGDGAHIEFIGAAATLIYREWKKSNLQDQMTRSTTLLLLAAILDNTLNLTSLNTTQEDVETFKELCKKEEIDDEWISSYFMEVQKSVEADLKNALFNDIKTISNNDVIPSKMAQICVWDAQRVLRSHSEIRQWFRSIKETWMINVIDVKNHCSYFVCDDSRYQKEIESIFNVRFESGIAKSSVPYLRKEIIKIVGGKK